MSLDPSQVEVIAHLARLGIDRQDIPGYARDLSAILELEAKMAEVDTTAIEPLAHPLDMVQRLRPDTVTEPDRREEFQALAPASEAGLYLVPRVIE